MFEGFKTILLGLAVFSVLGWVVVFGPTLKSRADAANQKKEIEDEVNSLGPADLDKRFDRWMRDKGDSR